MMGGGGGGGSSERQVVYSLLCPVLKQDTECYPADYREPPSCPPTLHSLELGGILSALKHMTGNSEEGLDSTALYRMCGIQGMYNSLGERRFFTCKVRDFYLSMLV